MTMNYDFIFVVFTLGIVAIVAIVFGQKQIALQLTKALASLTNTFSKLFERVKTLR